VAAAKKAGNPQTGKKKPVAFFLALALFALTNLVVASLASTYRQSIDRSVFAWSEQDSRVKPWSWWLARKWLEQRQAPDIVLFGSSQMGSAMVASDAKLLVEAIDALTHRRAATLEKELSDRLGHHLSAFSLASPGAMCSDAFMASSALFTPEFKPKVVVIGISPRDFIDNTMPYPAVTEPYKFYSHFVNPGPLTLHSYSGPMAWLQFAMESMPCRKLGESIQTSLASSAGTNAPGDKASNALAAVLGGGDAVPGKWLVPCVIPPMWADNTKEYTRRFKDPNPPVYTAEKAFFNTFLEKMAADDIRVLVVGMPSLSMNRKLLPDSFWLQFRSSISSACLTHNAQFLDLTGNLNFEKSDYLDTVHLNAYGGQKLFAQIASTIKENDSLCAKLSAPNNLTLSPARSNLRTAAKTGTSTR